MKRYLAILILIFTLFAALPVMAQDEGTAEPEPAAVATVTVDAPVDPAPVDNPVGSDDPAITLKWWQVIAGLFTAAAGGGLIGIAGFGVLATRIRNDAATMSAIEGLAKSVPADVVKVILDTAKSAQAIAGVLEEAFDGVPVSSKSPGGVSPAG